MLSPTSIELGGTCKSYKDITFIILPSSSLSTLNKSSGIKSGDSPLDSFNIWIRFLAKSFTLIFLETPLDINTILSFFSNCLFF